MISPIKLLHACYKRNIAGKFISLYGQLSHSEEGLSLVNVSTYRVIVFFNLKVKQNVKAVNHEKDYHDKFSIKVVK